MIKVFRLILKMVTDKKVICKQPVKLCVYYEIQCIEFLYRQVDTRDKMCLWTPLMRVAIINGNASVAAVLLKAGADVNVRDKAGKTPLMVQ